MSKASSAKYYQNKKERLHKKSGEKYRIPSKEENNNNNNIDMKDITHKSLKMESKN